MTAPTSTITRFCIYCDKETQVHAETGRCQKCGRATARGDVLDRLKQEVPASPNGTGPAAVPGKLVLQETPQLRKWVTQTQALSESFRERAAHSKQFAERFASEAHQLTLAAQAFASLLSQIGIEPAATPVQARTRLNGRWSLNYDACTDCGRTDSSHDGKGRCHRCNVSRRWQAKKGTA